MKFAFKLHPKGYEPEIKHARTLVGNGVDIDIKPNQADQQLHAYRVLSEHTKIVSFEPHQHAPGTRHLLGIPLAAGVLYPVTGLLITPMIAAAAAAVVPWIVVTNGVRLGSFKPTTTK